MYTVFVAVCLASVSPPACQEATALHWVVAPEAPVGAAGCLAHGMEYAAASRLVAPGTYSKVFCRRTQQVVADRKIAGGPHGF